MVAQDGVEKLGKAEAYLFELAKVRARGIEMRLF